MITNMQVVVLGVGPDIAEQVKAEAPKHWFPDEILVQPTVDPSTSPAPDPLRVRHFAFHHCSCGCRFCVYLAGDPPPKIPCPACHIEFEVHE